MWNTWIYRALTFLVISCPCALVISIPLGFFAGIGGASSCGVMVKGSKAGGAEVSDSVAMISAVMKGYGSVNEETALKVSDLAFTTAKLGERKLCRV